MSGPNYSGADRIGPEATRHGEAWKAFRVDVYRGLAFPPHASDVNIRREWLVFLAGWKAKAKQADVLRGQRYTGRAPL